MRGLQNLLKTDVLTKFVLDYPSEFTLVCLNSINARKMSPYNLQITIDLNFKCMIQCTQTFNLAQQCTPTKIYYRIYSREEIVRC